MAPWSIVLLGFGPMVVLFALIGAFFRIRPRVRPYAVAEGKVVEPTDADDVPDGLGGTVVQFVDRNGVSHQSSVAALRVRQPGTDLRIVYDTRDPGRASIDNFWTGGGSMFAMAGLVTVVTIIFVILVTLFP